LSLPQPHNTHRRAELRGERGLLPPALHGPFEARQRLTRRGQAVTRQQQLPAHAVELGLVALPAPAVGRQHGVDPCQAFGEKAGAAVIRKGVLSLRLPADHLQVRVRQDDAKAIHAEQHARGLPRGHRAVHTRDAFIRLATRDPANRGKCC
jgi:hypothetical protein